jgi:IclR family acetate operon transcriptional repressor
MPKQGAKVVKQGAKVVKIEERDKDQPSGALARGLAILDVILEAPHALTLADISKRARLDLSTTMRLLRALEESRHLLRVENGKRYAASPRAIMPLPVLHPLKQFGREVFPTLRELSVAVKATVVLVVFLEAERMVLDIAQSAGSLAPYYRTWLDGPLHASGSGKALLSTLTKEHWLSLLGDGPYPAVTEFSITNPAKLAADIENGRQRGYFVARDEHIVGLTAVSANIPTWQGVNVGCFVMTSHSRECTDEHIAFAGTQLRRAGDVLRHQAPSISAVSQYLGKSAGHN